MLNWDDLRLVLAVARDGSLVAAGWRLALDHTTLSRRLSALEAALGARLFDRSPRGATVTDAGRALTISAERMEAEVLTATAFVTEHASAVEGVVRLSTPDPIGTFLIAPNAHLLTRAHPALQLELTPESRMVSLSKREADIAIVLRQPPKGRVSARRLVDYRLGLYASRTYLAQAAPIRDPAEIGRHPLVWYIDELINMPELRFLHEVAGEAVTTFRSSSIVAQQEAVAGGLGLGMLHIFAAERDSGLVRILADRIEIKRSYWLVVHEDLRRLPRIRAVIDFIDTAVSTQLGQ